MPQLALSRSVRCRYPSSMWPRSHHSGRQSNCQGECRLAGAGSAQVIQGGPDFHCFFCQPKRGGLASGCVRGTPRLLGYQAVVLRVPRPISMRSLGISWRGAPPRTREWSPATGTGVAAGRRRERRGSCLLARQVQADTRRPAKARPLLRRPTLRPRRRWRALEVVAVRGPRVLRSSIQSRYASFCGARGHTGWRRRAIPRNDRAVPAGHAGSASSSTAQQVRARAEDHPDDGRLLPAPQRPGRLPKTRDSPLWLGRRTGAQRQTPVPHSCWRQTIVLAVSGAVPGTAVRPRDQAAHGRWRGRQRLARRPAAQPCRGPRPAHARRCPAPAVPDAQRVAQRAT